MDTFSKIGTVISKKYQKQLTSIQKTLFLNTLFKGGSKPFFWEDPF